MIKTRKVGSDIIISLFQLNKINILFSDLIGDQLKKLVEIPGSRILFDIQNIIFIDSAGFGMLIRIDEIARKNSSEFILCNISQEVVELFNLIDLQESLITSERNLVEESLLQEVE